MPEIVDLIPESITDGAVGVGLLNVAEVEVAVVHGVVLQKAGRNDVEVGHDVGERGGNVLVPVSCTVAYYETLQVVGLSLLVNCNELVVLMELPCEVGHVDASIGLT